VIKGSNGVHATIHVWINASNTNDHRLDPDIEVPFNSQTSIVNKLPTNDQGYGIGILYVFVPVLNNNKLPDTKVIPFGIAIEMDVLLAFQAAVFA